MSVCIAAIAERRKLVLISDHMVALVGGAFSSDESMLKGRELVYRQWAAGFAGDDVSRVVPILERTRQSLSEGNDWTVEQVAERLMREYSRERTAMATERHLSLYEMDMAQFLSNGSITFGDQGYGAMRERLEQVALDCCFMLHGFNPGGQPHIAVIEHPGTAQFINIPFWAIGSGAYAALSRLSLRQQTFGTSLEQTIYNVCEAKVAAERALGVGKFTTMEVFEAGKSPLRIDPKLGSEVLSVSARMLTPKVPDELLVRIKADLAHKADQRAKARQSSVTRAVKPSPKSPKRERKLLPPSQE